MHVSRSWRAHLRTLMLEVMAALADAEIRPPAEAAEVVETHSAVILAYGSNVLKIKKPVFLQFLDFRTAAARARACDREVELNRRLSPDVYLDSVTITGRGGEVHDHGVLMRRMPRDRCLQTLVLAGAEVSGEIRDIARRLALFHAACPRSDAISAEAGPPGLRRRWSDNLEETVRFRGALLDPATYDEIRRLALRYVAGRGPLFSARAAVGHMVDGHGDLIAADIYCLRDGVRAKVACLRWEQGRMSGADDARGHAELARAHLRAGQVTMTLVGGGPGTGKTTLAGRLADRLGHVRLSSDDIRRELDFPSSVRYSDLAKDAVYDEMLTRACRLLSFGESVVLDATWSREGQRRDAARAAATTSSTLVQMECRAPEEIAARRAERRRGAAGVSSEAGAALALTLAAERDPWPDAAIVDTIQDDASSLFAALAAVAAAGAEPS